jgi:hypothetical protein
MRFIQSRRPISPACPRSASSTVSSPIAILSFLADTSNHALHGAAQFRVSDVAPSWWDPFTGKIVRAEGGNRLDFDLAPHESRVVVFSKERVGELQAGTRCSGRAGPEHQVEGELSCRRRVDGEAPRLAGPVLFRQATYERSVTCHNPWRREART